MKLVAPCKGCEEREYGCHTHCMAYKRWKAKHEEIKIQMHEDNAANRDLEGRLRKQTWG